MTLPAPMLFALPAEPGRESEDACAIGDGVVVVADGAGLPKENRRGCAHSVAWYSRTLAEAFRVRLEDRGLSMTDALGLAISEVTGSHSASCDLSQGSPSATVAAWRIDGDHIEHLVLSDASIVLVERGTDDALGTVREITDNRLDAAVERRMTELVGERQLSLAEAAATRFAALEQVRNVEGGFWCCHTDPAAAQQAQTGRTPLAALAGIIAASDGGTRGFQLVGAHSPEQFAGLALTGDLAEIAAQIRAGEDRVEPRPFVKKHDDIAIVATRL